MAMRARTRTAAALAMAAALCLAAGCSRGEPPGGRMEWVETYAEGLLQASLTGKPAMLVFGAVWCPPCRELKQHVFTDRRVAEASKEMINIYIDVDQDRRTAAAYRVRAIPAVFFLSPSGEVIDAFKGEPTARNFARQMAAVAQRYKPS
jgi:protein disulfide-isomerase